MHGRTIAMGLGLLFSFHAQAGQEIGNGGDVIVSDSGDDIDVQLLDVYEAEAHHDLSIDFPDGEDFREILDRLLDRYSRLDYFRAEAIRSEIDEVFVGEDWNPEHADVLDNVILEDVPDDRGYLYIPRGYRVEQIVIQSLRPPVASQKRFTVSGDLWRELPAAHKAALAIHELIYAEALRNRASRSWKVRKLTGYIVSQEIAAMPTRKYVKLLKSVGFERAGSVYQGMRFRFGSIELYPSGKIKSGRLNQGDALSWTGAARVYTPYFNVLFHGLTAGGRLVNFAETGEWLVDTKQNGTLEIPYSDTCDGLLWKKSISITDGVLMKAERGPGTTNGQRVCIWDFDASSPGFRPFAFFRLERVEFYPNAEVKGIYWDHDWNNRDEVLRTSIHGQPAVFRDRLRFHPNRRISQGMLDEDAELLTEGGRIQMFAEGEVVFFAEDGHAILP